MNKYNSTHRNSMALVVASVALLGCSSQKLDNTSKPTKSQSNLEERTDESLVSAPDRARGMLAEMVTAGYEVPSNLSFQHEKQWDILIQAWDTSKTEIQSARRKKNQIGSRLAKEALDAGKYERFIDKEYSKPQPGEQDTRPWRIRNHPEEWITVQTRYNNQLESMTRDVVRFAPGDSLEMDKAFATIDAAKKKRDESVTFFFDKYRDLQKAK